MSDVVKRLRTVARECDGLLSAPVNDIPMIGEAADEIERLRTALAEIIELRPEDMYHGSENSTAAAIAREALKV